MTVLRESEPFLTRPWLAVSATDDLSEQVDRPGQ